MADVKTKSDRPKSERPPAQKQYFTVTVTGTIPVIIEYRIFAEDESSAYQLAERHLTAGQLSTMARPPKLDFPRLKRLKVTVKSLVTGMITWSKIFG